jgi:putative hydrolase of the HAD superfamily
MGKMSTERKIIVTIKAVLFDLDDTLLWDERSVREAIRATCEAVKKTYEVDPVELERAVRTEARALWESFDTYEYTKQIGINPFEGLWANFSGGENEHINRLRELVSDYRREAWTLGLQAVGVSDRPLGQKLGELFPQERRARRYVYEETYSVLKKLGESVPLLLITNGAPDLQKEKIAGVELEPYFQHIVISGSFGKGKPEASIFHYAMNLLGINAEEGLMVGDKLTTDILGANTVGMKSVWINRHNDNRTDEIVPSVEINNLEELVRIVKA